MVISWLHNNISDSIKKLILFINDASEVWKSLESRFQVVNGSRKYKLNKDLFSLKQNGLTLVEYYTALTSIWEELDNMNSLPAITVITAEIEAFLKALDVHKQEARLFQFLNGLDDVYAHQRSQVLMMPMLPSVEMSCSLVQQEESQRNTLKLQVDAGHEIAAMYSKANSSERCFECGGKGHTKANCWTIIGYPKWHSKNKKFVSNKSASSGAGKWQGNSGNRNYGNNKMVNNVVVQEDEPKDSNVMISAKQFEQLL
ncbi:uncharacterized protein LOC141686299 [Apium graveolens]|uniref:uncharacterized protein LOC141686299 n=1 Tax=Apium graveolens TaxID=4045 RepID=UPI003D7BAB7B